MDAAAPASAVDRNLQLGDMTGGVLVVELVVQLATRGHLDGRQLDNLDALAGRDVLIPDVEAGVEDDAAA